MCCIRCSWYGLLYTGETRLVTTLWNTSIQSTSMIASCQTPVILIVQIKANYCGCWNLKQKRMLENFSRSHSIWVIPCVIQTRNIGFILSPQMLSDLLRFSNALRDFNCPLCFRSDLSVLSPLPQWNSTPAQTSFDWALYSLLDSTLTIWGNNLYPHFVSFWDFTPF